MKKIILAIFPAILFAGSIIRIHINSDRELQNMLLSGCDITYYNKKTGEIHLYTEDITKIKQPFAYIIKDTKKWWQKSPFKINFGPYYTYSEAEMEMDNLHNRYSELVGEKFSIGTTWEGRTIWALKVTHFDGNEDTRPSVLYEAAIHAREPGGVSTLFGFLWYLAREYGKNPEVTELLNSRRLYFIPIVNPDGYVYNETSDGYWRKNKRDNNNDGTFEESDDGVDLNRNFSYKWGYDNYGSSPDSSSITYRGPYPFSEPETQAIKYFTDSIRPQTAIDYHTYSNLLMFPYGYDNIPCNDDAVIRAFASKMTQRNGYAIGRPGELLYNANGVTIDWWYNDSTHPKILAYTAEVGEAFWQPDTSIILDQINENIPMNMLLAEMSGPWIDIKNADNDTNTSLVHTFTAENISAKDSFLNGEITINTDSLRKYGISGSNPYNFSINSLGIIPADNDTLFTFSLVLPDSFNPGWLPVYFNVTSSFYSQEKKCIFIIGHVTPEFQCDFENGYSNFLTNHWDTTSTHYHSPYYSITDSKGGNYSNDDTSYFEIKDTFDLTDTTAIYYLTFYTKYHLETGYDYAYLQVSSVNDSDWHTLKTFNDSTDWHIVSINLQKYRGKLLKFRFYMTTDQYVTYDGIYVDDINFKKIPEFYSPSSIKETKIIHKDYGNINNLSLNSSYEYRTQIKIFDISGRMVFDRYTSIHKGLNTIRMDFLPPGRYTIIIDKNRYRLIIEK